MAVTASQVKELREKTGVGMMECKKALTENAGDLEKAILWLRERGLSRAAKKAGRVTAEGMVHIVISPEKNAGAIIELNCETDFVSKNDDFKNFAEEVATAALKHDACDVDTLKKVPLADGTTVGDKVTSLISTIGENINIRRVQVLKAANGTIGDYTHMGGKIGTLVQLEGASQSPELHDLAHDLAMHCAASAPRFLTRDNVTPEELEQEKELARKKLKEEGKPDDLVEKIMAGQLNKFYKEVCFVDQAFFKDTKLSVEKLVKEKGKGSKLVGYLRYQLGEGIEKKKEDFAAEVAATVGST